MIGVEHQFAVVRSIEDPVAVDVRIAAIAGAVAVLVPLSGVAVARAVVTQVADVVRIAVGLVIGEVRAVVWQAAFSGIGG